MKQATTEQLRQAAAWGERIFDVIAEVEEQQDTAALRLMRSILHDAMERVNEAIVEQLRKDQP
jgi:hypothetical protein